MTNQKEFRAIICFVLLGGIFGFCCIFSYIYEEMERLEPWKIILYWVGDLAAVLYFLFFCFGNYLPSSSLKNKTLGKLWYISLIPVFIPFGFDLSYTIYLKNQEVEAYNKAPIITAQAQRIKVKRYVDITLYQIYCKFEDKQAKQYHALVTVEQDNRKGFSKDLPLKTLQGTMGGKFPFDFKLRYDPKWPKRCWPDGGKVLHSDNFFFFSILVLFFQILAMLAFFSSLRENINKGISPWWYDLHKTVPLLAEAIMFAIFGPLFKFIWGAQ